MKPRYNFLNRQNRLTRGMIGAWPLLTPGGPVYDLNGYVNNGVLTNAPAWALGPFGWCLNFAGGTDYVSVPDSSSLGSIVNAAQMSASCWINGAAQSGKTFLAQYDTGTSQRSWQVGSSPLGGTNTLRVTLSNDGSFSAGHNKQYDGSIVCLDGQWHQVGFTWNAGSLKLFVDGREDGSVTTTVNDAITNLHNSTAALTMGCALSSGSAASQYTGKFDLPMVWSRELSTSGMKLVYQRGVEIYRRYPELNAAA